MARTATLKPSLRKARQAQGIAAWCVGVPPKLSESGNRQELFFSTKSEATGKCEELQTRRHNFGTSLNLLSASKITQATKAFELLEPLGIDLLDAVRSHIDAHNLRTASVTFLNLFNLFLEEKADLNAKYLRELRITRDRFSTLHNQMVCDITARDLDPFLSAITPGGRAPVMRYLRAVFFFGIRKGFLAENPIARLTFPKVKRKEVETISNYQAEAMLYHALEHDLPLLPYLVLGLFTGIRPDGELQKLEWSDVKWETNKIVIRPEISKTNRRRFPELEPNAISWLNAYKARGGTFTGKVSPYSDKNLVTHRRANWRAAGVTKWIQQGMRHTFCSNWLAAFEDVNKLVLLSGHDSISTMWKNYHQGILKTEALKFWSIVPPEASNVVAFSVGAA